METSHVRTYLDQTAEITKKVDHKAIERIAQGLASLRSRGGRLFVIGVGGSAANSMHLVADFRKLTGIEAYSVSDNVAELTARTNDEGWATVFDEWLRISRINNNDVLLVLSVGGGNEDLNVSPNIVMALKEAKSRDVVVYGIVGRDGGYTKEVGDEVIVIPTIDPDLITPHAESFQAVIWHCLVFHPVLKIGMSKWEGLSETGETG